MKNTNKSRQKIKLIETQERRSMVLELKKRGFTYRKIAKALEDKLGKDKLPGGWDGLYACKDVARELDTLRKNNQEEVRRYRDLQLARYEDVLAGVYEAARKGNAKDVSSFVSVMTRIDKLCGTEDAIKHDVKSGGEPIAVRSQILSKLFANVGEDGGDKGDKQAE